MPECHTVHRVAKLFRTLFSGHQVHAESPQGRFRDGAALISGRVVTGVEAVGKQLFISFDNGVVLRVHLGIYGAWDVATLEGGRAKAGLPSANSLGAPRVSRTRLAELEAERSDDIPFPPAPVGAVRLRLETDFAVADLRGPTACEILTPDEAHAVRTRLGPDPLVDSGPEASQEFERRLLGTSRAIGVVLMDQSVVSGIGNVYRAEILFRHRLDPYLPAKNVGSTRADALWQDWSYLLRQGVKTGVMLTRDDLDAAGRKRALRSATERHYVYKRAGKPCVVCGVDIQMDLMATRKLYYCPSCQHS